MLSDKLKIRKVDRSEVEKLQRLALATFVEAFGPHNRKEDMDDYVGKHFSMNRVKAELNNPESEFYFAELGDQALGYLKLNSGKAQTEMMDNALELERIYVLKEYRNRKAGQLLLEKAFEIARAASAVCLWLGVWDKNDGAIRFYERNGFVIFDKHTFWLGEDKQTDIMMRVELGG